MPPAVIVCERGDKESICDAHELRDTLVAGCKFDGRCLTGSDGLGLLLSYLDILRAISEGLLDSDSNAAPVQSANVAVQPVAATRLKFDPKQADCFTFRQTCSNWIFGIRLCSEQERALVRTGKKAGLTGKQACPWLPSPINSADDNERQLAEELAMLLRQMVTDHPLAGACQLPVNTVLSLQSHFSRVER